MRIEIIPKLLATQMQTGQAHPQIDVLLLDTSSILDKTKFIEIVGNKM